VAKAKKIEDKKVAEKKMKKDSVAMIGVVVPMGKPELDSMDHIAHAPTMTIRMSSKAKLRMKSIARYLGIDESIVATQAANELYGRFESSMKFFGKEIVKGLQVIDKLVK
jgi:predicted transcriptional regulator